MTEPPSSYAAIQLPTSILMPVHHRWNQTAVLPMALGLGRTTQTPVCPLYKAGDPMAAKVTEELIERFPQLSTPVIVEAQSTEVTETIRRSALIASGPRPSRGQGRIQRGATPRTGDVVDCLRIVAGPSFQPIRRFRLNRIALPIDGTPLTAALLPQARCWAAAHGLTIKVIALVSPEPPPIRHPLELSAKQQFSADPNPYLDRLLAELADEALTIEVDVVAAPIGTARALASALRPSRDSFLLAPTPTSHSRRPLRSPWPSLITQRSPVPVLFVPPHLSTVDSDAT